MPATWLVVGLGNPGPTYSYNRHNVGYMVVDEIARRAQSSFSVPKGIRAEVATTRLAATGWGGIGADADRVALMKSRSYMNESGGPVSSVMKYVGADPEHLIVIHDELDIDFSMLRLKRGGGDNGHNGLKSIRASIATGDFFRIRVGIGRPPGQMAVADFVLQNFANSLREELALNVANAADAVADLIAGGLPFAQNRHNT
ncbi:MAG: aminoacyl-tRNA hydrolase [Propionibacteriaceae bacterium]